MEKVAGTLPSSLPYISAPSLVLLLPNDMRRLQITLVNTASSSKHISTHRCPPSQDSITLAHVSQVRDQLPHRRVVDSNVLDINCDRSESRPT